jgi:hypothetical protein
MFERFRQRYQITSRLEESSLGDAVEGPLKRTSGYEGFMREYAGVTFNDGVYRIHTLKDRAKWTRLIVEASPAYRGRISAFGCDWLGRQFTLDFKRDIDKHHQVLMFEPGTGLVLQIPSTFQSFHEEVLIEQSDAAISDIFFREWLRAGNRGPGPTECAGYKVPLFMSGADTIDNLELVDMEVYWEITAQLVAQIRNLPEGTPIGKITIE